MTLGDALMRVVGGGTPSRDVAGYWGGEIPWAGVKDLKSFRLSSTEERITEAGLENSSTRLIPRGTVVVATRMAVGRVVWTDIDTAINQDLKALVAGPRLHPRFLFHFMRSNERRLESKGSGTTVSGIRLDTLLRLPLLLPPLFEQQAVAATLDAIDEAIERTLTAIAATESLRRALLRELLTRGLPGWHTQWKGVARLGSIPACWEAVKLNEVLLDVEAGSAPPRLNRQATNDEWGVLRVGSVTWGEYRQAENKALKPGTRPDPSLEVHAGDLLLSRANTPELVGRTVLVRATPPRRLLSDKTLRLVPATEVADQEFLHLVLSAATSRAQLTGAASGSSRSMFNVSQQSIRNVTVPLPPRDEQWRITNAAAVLGERMEIEAACLVALRAVKNAASEALLTGRLRVSDIARPAVSA